MRLTRNKWWGKPGRFRRQMMVLYGRLRHQVMVLYGRVQKEDAVLNMSVVVPINLTIAIVIVHIVSIVIMWGGFDVEVIRNFILLLASVWAFYGIIVAARRTKALEKQVHIQEQGQVAERLARAAEQLSSAVMSVRILAILSLGKIAIEAESEIRQDVVKVLCAYIRENRPIGQEDAKSANSKSPMPGDIQEILNVLSGIKTKTDWKIVMDLSKINLSGADLSCADLSDANLERADLSGANLQHADLSDANLEHANLSDANLERIDLSSAILWNANLSGANLTGAYLWRAGLSGANLSGAELPAVTLSGANLTSADLSRATLSGNLSGASLWAANLSGAGLRHANLSGADLRLANLQSADLWHANLSDVKGIDTAKNLKTVNNPPPEILAEIARRSGQK